MGKGEVMRKMVFGLMVAFFLVSLVGCACPSHRKDEKVNSETGENVHQHTMPANQASDSAE